MSTSATAEAKKRIRTEQGRAEEATPRSVKTQASTVKKPIAKISSRPLQPEEVLKKKKTQPVAQTSKPIPTNNDAPTPTSPPGTSEIIDQVRASGTLGKINAIQDEGAVIGATQKTTATQNQDLTSQSLAPNPPPPAPQPLPNQSTRNTTIRLPSSPKKAPSPILPLPSSAVKPAPPGYRAPQPKPQPQPQPQPAPAPAASQKPYPRPHTRIIEPTPNTKLPPKYRPAARRVTAIIVGLPFVVVLGWELWERWNGKVVPKRFGDEGGLRGPRGEGRGRVDEGV